MAQESGRNFWPVVDFVALALCGGVFFAASAVHYSLIPVVSHLLLISWPFFLLAYILLRAHAFGKHDEDVEAAGEGYVVASAAFYIIAFSGPVLMALYRAGQAIPDQRNLFWGLSIAVCLTVAGALLAGIDYIKSDDDRGTESFTSYLFIPISFLSALFAFGTHENFEYATWLIPSYLASFNQDIRIVILVLFVATLVALVILDTIIKILFEGIGFGERWKELQASMRDQPRSRGVLSGFIRAGKKFAKFLANIARIIVFTVGGWLTKLVEALRNAVAFINFGRIYLVIKLSLVTAVGIIMIWFAPQAGLAAYYSVYTATYDSGITIVGLLFVVWCGVIAVFHSHLRESRHFEVPESFASVVLFACLGIWTASAIFHSLNAFGVLNLPGMTWTTGPFFVVFGVLGAVIILWEAGNIFIRGVLVCAGLAVLAFWGLQAWPRISQVQLPSVADALDSREPRNDGHQSEIVIAVPVQEVRQTWIYGRWGLGGSCLDPFDISGSSNELVIARAGETERLELGAATGDEIVAGAYRFARTSGSVTMALNGENIGTLQPCAR